MSRNKTADFLYKFAEINGLSGDDLFEFKLKLQMIEGVHFVLCDDTLTALFAKDDVMSRILMFEIPHYSTAPDCIFINSSMYFIPEEIRDAAIKMGKEKAAVELLLELSKHMNTDKGVYDKDKYYLYPDNALYFSDDICRTVSLLAQ